MTIAPVSIAGRPVGPGHPPYVVAEMSANHLGDLDRALATLAAAQAAGADAVKLQTYTADTLTIDCDRPEFTIRGGLWDGRRLYDLYREAEMPWSWHEALFARGRELGITVFSTPFDETAVALLEALDAPAYKIASFELVDIPLIERAAATGRPLILSTGMGSEAEIAEALAAARRAGGRDLVLLHCVSGYPTPVADSNLRKLPLLAGTFRTVTGLSDHTIGINVPIAAVAMGAAMIEKHFTLARADGGPDAAFSLEPGELARLVTGCREAWEALGRSDFERPESERGSVVFRRSLYVVEDVPAGAVLTAATVRPIRPGCGLAPRHLPDVLGRKATRDLARGTPLAWDMVE